MTQLTIYVDRKLGQLIRDHEIPVSVTCQRALRRQVRIAERQAEAKAKAADVDAAETGRRHA